MSPSEGISLEAHGCHPGLLGLLTLQALISQVYLHHQAELCPVPNNLESYCWP